MQVYKTIGHVTLSRGHDTLRGGKLVIAEAYGAELVGRPKSAEEDMVVVWDDLGAGPGALIAVSDGAEAAQPFKPNLKPVDAYNSAILDEIHLDPEVIKLLK